MTLLDFSALFQEFHSPSWDGWRAILRRLTDAVREFYAVVGRGAGKSRIAALLACFFAVRQYARAPGESIYLGVFAPDRRQAAITFRYVLGLLRSVPSLAALIVRETQESVELANGVIIEVITATLAAPRGRSYALCIVEEAAFLPTDQSANPDTELLRALRPALARVPGSLLAVVSSPYARRGVLWTAHQKYHGQPDSDVVYVQAETLSLNPTFDRRAVDKAYAEDPASAAAEFGGQFRADLESFVSFEALRRVVMVGRLEWSPVGEHVAFVDPSGGGGQDAMTLAIAHAVTDEATGQTLAVLSALREITPPFSPEAAVGEFAATLRVYGVDRVVGDAYAGTWPAEAFQRAGITYVVSEKTKRDMYLDFLPALHSQRVRLLDAPRLLAQFGALERRVGFGGRDSVDHPPRGHDDVANAAAGALGLVLDAMAQGPMVIDVLGEDRRPAAVIQAEAAVEHAARVAAGRASVEAAIQRTGAWWPEPQDRGLRGDR